MEKFSIIIPLYNKDDSIVKTLHSILNQTYREFEIIVVDDGSTDKSYERAKEVRDERIRVIRQPNGGVSAARNRGIEEAKYKWVAFLDADDVWDEDYLETQKNLIERYPECAVFGTNYRFRDCNGKSLDTILNHIPFDGNDGILSNYFKVASTSHVPVWSSAVVIRKDAIKEVGGFPVGIKSGEDLLTWARLAVRHKIAYCSIPHATYNLDTGYEFGAEPVRRQDEGDPVGKELKALYDENREIPDFKNYLSHWHRMRASVAIRFGERMETIRESIKALRYNPVNHAVLPFIMLSVLPSGVCKRIISMKRN